MPETRVRAIRWSLFCSLLPLAAVAGCQKDTLPQGIPKGASLLAEAVGPTGERDSEHEPPWEVETDGVLYIRDATQNKVVRGPVRQGQTLRLYPGWVSVAGAEVDPLTGALRPKKYLKERRLAHFLPNHRYQLYYRPGVDPELEQAMAKAQAEAATQPTPAWLQRLQGGPTPVEIRRDADFVRRQAEQQEAGPSPLPPRNRPNDEEPSLVPLPR